jgi:hypothetical protein
MKSAFLIFLLSVFLFAEEENSLEKFLESMQAQFLEQVKSELKAERSQTKEKDREIYLSVKIYDNIGKPGSMYFGANGEIGGFFRKKGIMFSWEMGGGYANWGAGLNVGLPLELPNKHLLVPGISSGFWILLNDFYYSDNVNSPDYEYQLMFGGPFVKYLIGKENRYFEISARAFIGKAVKNGMRWIEDSDNYAGGYWGYDTGDVFLINANIACGITILF